MFRQAAVAPPRLPEPLTPVSDRISNNEAMLVSFLAEKSLPFSLGPDILELAKTLAQDKKVLAQMSMHRTSASYKLQYGVAKTFKEKLFGDLQDNFFSLNIDECTSNNFEKIISVLVNIPNEYRQIVTKHLSSFSIVRGDSETIFQGIVKIFEENNIPWNNLISVLLDSCNVMRGKKAGLETKLRIKCPHLLDIGGDTCHHAHNAAKMFCKPFGMYLESLIIDIHNDFKWSPDLRAALQEICYAVNIKYTMPQSFISVRWLSIYDCTVDLQRMFSALTLFYFSFLSKEQKRDYLHIIVKIYKCLNVSDPAKDAIRSLQSTLSKKNMTEQGKSRKDRIVQKLFGSQLHTKLIMGIFLVVLPLLKEYVLMFEASSPLIHVLYEKQWSLLKNFLACFVKPEALDLIGYSSKKMKNFKVEHRSNHLPMCSVFVGDTAKQLILLAPKSQAETIKEFRTKTMTAYVGCAKTLIAKMPFSNPFLKAVSTLDPSCRKHSTALRLMEELPNYVTNVISSDEQDLYNLEARRFQNDCFRPIGDNESIDMWWRDVAASSKYPLLSKLAVAVLTCFHGPKVEGSFSMMNNILTPGSSRMNVSTFDAVQSVKYELLSEKKSSVSMFAKKDFLKESVDPKLCFNMKTSYKLYREKQIKNKTLREERKKQVSASKEKMLSKSAAKKLSAEAARKQRVHHKKQLKNNLKSSVIELQQSKKKEVNPSINKSLDSANTRKRKLEMTTQQSENEKVISTINKASDSVTKKVELATQQSEKKMNPSINKSSDSVNTSKRKLEPNTHKTGTKRIKLQNANKNVLTIKEMFMRANHTK